MMLYRKLPIDTIQPPIEQHRADIDPASIDELAADIKQRGLLQPIKVHPLDQDTYEIIFGHRRYLACQALGWTHVPAFITGDAGDDLHADRFAENVQREALSPFEEAAALARITEHNPLTPAELARHVRKSETWVRQRVTLMQLPEDLQALVHTRHLPLSTAITLGTIEDEEHRHYLTDFALQSGASQGVIAQWVNEWRVHQEQRPDEPPPKPQELDRVTVPLVEMPCFACHVPTDYTKMVIVRLCHGCYEQLNETTGA